MGTFQQTPLFRLWRGTSTIPFPNPGLPIPLPACWTRAFPMPKFKTQERGFAGKPVSERGGKPGWGLWPLFFVFGVSFSIRWLQNRLPVRSDLCGQQVLKSPEESNIVSHTCKEITQAPYCQTKQINLSCTGSSQEAHILRSADVEV